MKRFLLGMVTGGVGGYFINKTYGNQRQGLDAEEHSLVETYIGHHGIRKMVKYEIMNGYMQLNRAFLDHGMRVRLDGFKFYDSYFNAAELSTNSITKGYCVFSPNQELCGHPNIAHGGATATIADQNSGMLAMLFSRELVATGELDMKYKKPVKKGQLYAWKGVISRREDRKIYVSSTIQELETGTVCVESQAVMVTVNWEHKMADVFKMLFKKEEPQPQTKQ